MIGIYIKCNNCLDCFLIDSDDYELVNKFKWFKVKDHRGTDYFRYQAHGSINGKLKTFPIHRLIMNFPDGLIDHINRQTWDNRKINLRMTTQEVNATNYKYNRRNKTGVLGVYRRGNKFVAQININKKRKYLGQFNTIEEAGEAYKKALQSYKPQYRIEDEA